MRSLYASVAVAVAAVAVGAGVLADDGAAAIRVLQDDEGRDIRLDLRARVDVPAYRRIIAGLVHGDEIEDVTFRIVPERRVRIACLSAEALACYSADPGMRPTIVLPALRPAGVRNVLIHEYGHHLDRTYDHRGKAPDFDGTARWWSVRGMSRLLSERVVAWGYERGWGRSLAEIYAEDYVVLNVPRGPYDIFWLQRPGARVRAAMRADITDPSGLSRQRLGPTWLRAASTRTVNFNVAAGRRRIVVITRVRNPGGRRPIRSTLTCANGAFVRSALSGRGRLGAIRVRGAPPGRCELTLATGKSAVLYESTILHKR